LHKIHRIKLCGQNVEFLNVKTLKDILEGFQTENDLGTPSVRKGRVTFNNSKKLL
jgi:hypothetical protein